MTAQLNINTLIFLLSAIGLIVFPHVYNLPGSVFGFFCFLLAWRFVAIWRPNWLPGRLALLLLTVIGIALLYLQHQGLLGRDAGTRLFVVALGLKLMEIKSSRDTYLITFLAFIVATSQFLYQQSIVMAVYILFVCCVLLGTLVSINSIQPRHLAALKTAAIVILQAIPMAIVIFIFFPRIPAPRWMYFNDGHQAKMGLSDTMEPGSINNLSLSDELVFRVKFTGAIPPPAQRYWRGPVLSRTDGKKWMQATNLAYLPAPQKPVFSGTAYQYKLLMEPQHKNWVFALDMPADYSDPLSLNANYQLISAAQPNKRAEYKIISFPTFNTGNISAVDYRNAMQLPDEPSARMQRLVKQLHGIDNPPLDFIKHTLNHFKTEDFHYTLKPPLLAENPIESFLFETRHGFCEHYAAAFVYLMRVGQVPARVVTGYQGGELNKVGNFLDIKQAHAHAWAEVWLERQGWVRIDPTAAIAPERIEQDINIDQQIASGMLSYASATDSQAAFSWLKQTRQFWGNVDYNWQRWVINYDTDNQSRFLSAFGIKDMTTMVYWMAGIVSVLTAFLSAWLFYSQKKPRDPVLANYQRFCNKIAQQGLSRDEGEGVIAFAERIKLKLPEHAQNIDDITALFIQLRYGKQPNSKDFSNFHRQIAQLKIPNPARFKF